MKLSDEPKEPGMVGFWEKIIGQTDNVGFFGIAQHISISEIQVQQGETVRCDATSRKGPHGLHKWLGDKCSCGSLEQPYALTGNHYITFENVAAMYPVIEAVPHGHIMYFELLSPEDEVKTIEKPHSECARTLQEIFRLLLEWDFAYTDLGNREITAIVSHGIVETLEIPESIKQWILAEVPAEKVVRFIGGINNAQERTDQEIPTLPDEFSEWLYSKIIETRSIGGYDS